MDSAASIRPKGISRMEVSTILAVYGIAAIVRNNSCCSTDGGTGYHSCKRNDGNHQNDEWNGTDHVDGKCQRLIEYRANENSVLLSDYEQDAKRYSDNGCDNG